MRARVLAAASLALGMAGFASAQEDSVVQACVARSGAVRLAVGPEECRSSEQPLTWQRGGGAWVHDANGRPLGRSMGARFGDMWVFVEPGIRVRLSAFTGDLTPGSSLEWVRFSEPGCRGTAFAFRAVPGDLVTGFGSPPRLFLTSERRVESFVSRSRLTPFGCQDTGTSTLPGYEAEPFTGDLGFELPAPAPLRFGTGPLGPGEDERIQACVGPSGALRSVAPGTPCRPSESPTAWQRIGGPRVYDGTGRDLGAALPLANLLFQTGSAVLNTREGVWFQASPARGGLETPTLFFSAPGCQGPPMLDDPTLSSAGRLARHPVTQELLVARAERVIDAPSASFHPLGQAVCSEFPGTRTGHPLEPFQGDLGYDFPLPAPLSIGFPGSPVADPLGGPVAPGLFHVCVGPDGRLRAVAEPSACRVNESGHSWPRRGGLRAQDGARRDLGTFLAEPASNVGGDTMRILDDASGLRFDVQFIGGELGDEVTRPQLEFSGPFCTGTPFRYQRAVVGLVFPRPRPPARLLVGVRLETLRPLSILDPFSGCVPAPSFFVPQASTVVEDFSGTVPFETPVEGPLRVGSGLE